MASGAKGEATVADLLGHFQTALRALVPAAEAAGVPWRSGEAYDEWDDIASALYVAFVASSLVPEQPEGRSPPVLPLAPYDLRLPDYEMHSAIVVESVDATSDSRWAFNRLASATGHFEVVQAVPLDARWRSVAGHPVELEFDDVAFRFLRRHADGAVQLVPPGVNIEQLKFLP